MRPLPRLEAGPKYGAILDNYFFRGPKAGASALQKRDDYRPVRHAAVLLAGLFWGGSYWYSDRWKCDSIRPD